MAKREQGGNREAKKPKKGKIQSERRGSKHDGSYATGSDEVTQEVTVISTQSQATSLERRLDFRGIKKPPRISPERRTQLYLCVSMHQYLSGRQVKAPRSGCAVIADRGQPRAPEFS